MCNGRWLETDLRATHEFEVMVDAVVPVHLIAGFQTDAECACIELNAAAWIEDAVSVAIPNGADLVCE